MVVVQVHVQALGETRVSWRRRLVRSARGVRAGSGGEWEIGD